jgi:hypothetical protein
MTTQAERPHIYIYSMQLRINYRLHNIYCFCFSLALHISVYITIIRCFCTFACFTVMYSTPTLASVYIFGDVIRWYVNVCSMFISPASNNSFEFLS